MDYRFEPSELDAIGIARIRRALLDKVMHLLSAPDENAVFHIIHAARKALKKLRALCRLVQDVRRAEFKQEDHRYRAVARKLCQWREASVAQQIARGFVEAATGFDEADRWSRLLRALQDEAPPSAQDAACLNNVGARLIHKLHATDLASISCAGTRQNFGLIEPGFRRTYTKMRKMYQRVTQSDDVEIAHDWRKFVKYHSHHLRLLQIIWPDITGRCRALDSLADILGEDHDLADFRARIKRMRSAPLSRHDIRVIRTQIDLRRAALRTASIRLGARLTVDKPADLVQRLAARLDG